MTPRELGPYLLLRKLSEDALSEIYRAGQKSGDDVERVVLLCFFKARQEDAAWLAETATVGRRALKGLSSPCLPDVVDSGEAAGSAYLAYDYVSGVGLLEVMERAHREGIAVPLEVALHIVDRVATALLAAWEHESRMLHGFVVPQLVMLSNEGEVYLLGIEVASRLRRLLTDDKLESEVRSYLAPEVVPQGQAATTDDVYSLGALLFALTTGRPLPLDESGPAAAIREAELANGGELPEAVRQLLTASLASAPNRARLAAWSESLHELVLSDQYDATSFNLAVYLHRLLGDELEEAAEPTPREMAPKTLSPEAPALVSPAPEPALEPPFDLDSPAISPSQADDELLARATEEHQSRRPLLAAAAVVALLVAGGAAYYFGRDSGADGQEAMQQMASRIAEPATVPGTPGASDDVSSLGGETSGKGVAPDAAGGQEAGAPVTPPPATAQPTKEDLDRRVNELVAKQSKQIEGALRGEYEDEIAALRQQLADLAAAQSQQEPPSTTGSEPATSRPAETMAAGATTGPARSGEGMSGPPTTGLSTAAPSTDPQAEPAAAQPAETTVALGSEAEAIEPKATEAGTTQPESVSPAANQPDSETTRATQTASSPAQKPEAAERSTSAASPGTQSSSAGKGASAAEEVRQPPVRYGELVESGPGVDPPELQQSVDPVYPMVARRLGRTAVVNLRLLIDENGDVTDVEQLSEKAGFGFDEAAITAARRMKWQPATKSGVRVKIWWPVRIAFQP